jgi:hypothetical protein
VAAKPIILRRNDVINEKTQAALSQIGREEKTAAADKVSPIVRHRASMAQPKVMGFAEPVIGPATSGRTRWLNPSDGLEGDQLGELGRDVCHRIFCSTQAASRAEQGADIAESFVRRVVHNGDELVTR